LTALAVNKAKKKGLLGDGGGLYLQIGAGGNKSWLFRYMMHGNARKMGLGALNAVPLASAREKAAECRKLVGLGADPLTARKADKAKAKLAAAKGMTFKQCAETYIESHKAGWRNEKHAAQWDTSLETYVYPLIGNLPVQDIDVALIMKVLEQKKEGLKKGDKDKKFWEATPETANRVRNRIESILDWATAREYRRGENPARWRGHLENLLPRRSKLKGVKHHAALPYDEIGDFVQKLKQQEGMGIDAFEFLILTAARTGEVTGARWSEFDLEKKIWTIPANRIKAGREHRVPLAERAAQILKKCGPPKPKDEPEKQQALVFPGRNKGKPLSKMGLLTLLKHMKRRDITVHGFRSSFRDWCAEQTAFSREVAESALAHVTGDKTELAYRRGDLFEKRRRLMDAWAAYCAKPSVKNTGSNVSKMARRN
jgi:integrase